MWFIFLLLWGGQVMAIPNTETENKPSNFSWEEIGIKNDLLLIRPITQAWKHWLTKNIVHFDGIALCPEECLIKL
jgi:hypothetical protein